MNSEDSYLELLRRLDDTVRSETPKGFRAKVAEREMLGFVAKLESRIGQQLLLTSGLQIQDASFYAEVEFPPSYGFLRFSNFGRMLAFTPDNEIPARIISAVAELASESDFVVVPTEVLETKYTGSLPAGSGAIESWWVRYFDYL